MSRGRIVTAVLVVVLTIASGSAAQNLLTDPYKLLDKYFVASGGLDRLRAEVSHHATGILKVAGLTGTIEIWSAMPDKSVAKIDLGILKMTQGDNGEAEWVVDSNEKLQVITNFDEAERTRRKVQRMLATYDYADPNSPVFTVVMSGTDTVDSRTTYVVTITNSLNDDRHTLYIDTKDFLLRKSTSIEADASADTYPGDYRLVDGLQVPFYTREIPHETGQVQEILLETYVSNPEIDPVLFDPPEATGPDYRFVEGDRAEDIPFLLLENHLYIPVTVGCRQRYWILDTGAAVTVIAKAFAEELGLTFEGEMVGTGSGGTVDIEFTDLPPFTVPGIEFDEQVVAVIDLTEIDRLLPIDAVGILGYDFLSRFVTKIDYANQTVSFYNPETFVYDGNGHEVDAHIQDGVFAVPATLDGTHAGTWLFDIGASGTSIETAFAQANGYTKLKGVDGLGRGAANEFKRTLVRATSLEFAGFTIDRPLISYRSDSVEAVRRRDEIGVLGNSFFRNFVIYCDYANEHLIIERGSDFNVEPPIDRSGLQLRRSDDGRPEVLFVAAGTPAAKAGITRNDVIGRVNGISVEHMDGLKAVRALFREKAGTDYDILLVRDGREKQVKMRLADLL